MQRFVRELEASGELVTIPASVNPILEISEIADRFMKMPDGGKALLFTNNGTDFPLLINAFGSEKRILQALNIESFDELPAQYIKMLKKLTRPASSLPQRLSSLPALLRSASYLPRIRRRKAICQQVIHNNPDLGMLPVLQCWPNDGGRFITLPVVITRHPVTGVRNVGMYRMQIFDRNTTGMHWHLHKGGAAHYDACRQQNKILPVAVILGGDPVYTYAATAPLPDGIDEFIAAGFMRRKRVKLVKCITQDIEVPEDADIVIEGFIDPTEPMRTEGPFGDHTGVYSLPDSYPVFHVTCITHRRNAIYPATIVGVPPMEDRYLALATEKFFVHPLRLMHEEIIDMHLPWFGVAHNLVFLKLKTRYPGHAFKIMHSMLGNGQMMFAKVLVCVSDDVDFNNEDMWLPEILQRIHWLRDSEISRGPADVLDHAAYTFAYGGKLLIDATMPKSAVESNNGGIKMEYLGMGDALSFEQRIDRFMAQFQNHEMKLVVFAETNLSGLTPALRAWYVLNNIDPSADCKIVGNCLFVNATVKSEKTDNFVRDWPNVVCMDEKTIQKMDERWYEITGCNPVTSPSRVVRGLLLGEGAVAIKNEI